MFALFSGLLGTAFSVLIRMELSGPGVQYIADNQLYNSIVTAHALLMIFFMVKSSFATLYIQLSGFKDLVLNVVPFPYGNGVVKDDWNLGRAPEKYSGNNFTDVIITGNQNNYNGGNPNNNNDGDEGSKNRPCYAGMIHLGKAEPNLKPKYKYVKVLVNDPFNNRDIILKVAKNQKGVYL